MPSPGAICGFDTTDIRFGPSGIKVTSHGVNGVPQVSIFGPLFFVMI